MLALGITDGELITIGDDIRLCVSDLSGNLRIYFEAPPEVRIDRHKGEMMVTRHGKRIVRAVVLEAVDA